MTAPADDDLEEQGADDEEGLLEGRRLQLIPHDVDSRYVFRFEFGPAILAQVLEKIALIPSRALVEVTMALAPYPGFYQLFRNDQSVYIGRTIRPVAQRLAEHARKLRGRVPLVDMSARYLFVEDLSLVGLSEDAMIAYFHPLGLDPWGKMGFGSKPTGFNRSRQQSDWHAANPPDLRHEVTAGDARSRTLRQIIRQVARGAPLTVSIPAEFTAAFDADHASPLNVESQTMPFAEWIDLITAQLRPGWIIRESPMAWYVVNPSLEED